MNFYEIELNDILNIKLKNNEIKISKNITDYLRCKICNEIPDEDLMCECNCCELCEEYLADESCRSCSKMACEECSYEVYDRLYCKDCSCSEDSELDEWHSRHYENEYF